VRILVLGGTSFIGRAIVTDALETGAEVMLFGRGSSATRPGPGPQACLPPRWRWQPPTCWPGTASTASRRWGAVTPSGGSRGARPAGLDAATMYQDTASRLFW